MRRWILALPLLVALGCGDKEPLEPEGPGLPLAPPTFVAISPAPWTVVSDTTTIGVLVSEADSVLFRIGPDTLGCDSVLPYELAWRTEETPNGVWSLTIRAANLLGTTDTTLTYMIGNIGGERVVVVFPQTATVGPEGTAQFSAVVLGAVDETVGWSLRAADPLDGDADLGAIDATGLYQAPKIIPPSGRVLVDAITVDDPKRGDAAEVTLSQGIAVEVTSVPETIYLGRTFSLEAKVYGTGDQRVQWSVEEGASHGIVDEAGLYHAPTVMPASPQVTFRAVSLADPAESDTGSGLLLEPLVVSITPQSTVLAGGGSAQFVAEVQNTEDETVTWSVDGGAAYGSISADGLYTAPLTLPNPPTATVRARSALDDLAVDSASVDLVPAPPAGEGELISETFWAGYQAAIISDQVSGIVFHALHLAREANEGLVATIGTLEQTGSGWILAPGPADRLVILPLTGPVWSVEVLSFGPHGWSWPDDFYPDRGYGYRDTLDCRITVDGHALRLTSTPVSEDPWWKPACVQTATDFLRTLQGSIGTREGGAWTLDIEHEGWATYGSCMWGTRGTVVGQVTTESGVDLSLDYEFDVAGGCDDLPRCFSRWEFSGDMTASAGGVDYAWNGVAVKGSGGEGMYVLKVTRADLWAAEGTLSKNGLPYGEIYFDGPVIEGTNLTVNARLDYAPGYSVNLVPPRVPEWHDVETVVPNPFQGESYGPK